MIEPLLISVGVALLLCGLVTLVNSRSQRKAGVLVDASSLGVSGEEQAWMAREARAMFIDPRAPFCHLQDPTEFDRQMLILFDFMETGNSAEIDTQIQVLKEHLNHQPFFQRWSTSNTLLMVHQQLQGPLTLRARKLKTKAAWQMVFNWNRLIYAAGSTFGSSYTISRRWIGPDNSRFRNR